MIVLTILITLAFYLASVLIISYLCLLAWVWITAFTLPKRQPTRDEEEP